MKKQWKKRFASMEMDTNIQKYNKNKRKYTHKHNNKLKRKIG